VDQTRLLARADLVVHHGGSGTTLGALAAGTPQLVLPQGADQFANAEALCRRGVALRLDEVSADAVTEQATRLLQYDSGFRDAAYTLAGEVAGMPSPEEVAHRLPGYARG
jgi:UDP:flavonoid glycosyltransferase YjiC (YdhE family)